MKTYSLYCLTLLSDGRKYFGITSRTPKERWGYGCGYGIRTHIGAAIRKYGWNAFSHEVLLEGLTHDEATEKEKWYIKEYNTTNPKCGFNVTAGGDGINGYVFTEQDRKKMSESHKGCTISEEQRKKISASLKEYYKTHTISVPYSHIMKMVEARKNLPNPCIGRVYSAETREKLRIANLGKKASEETRMKMRNSASKRAVALLDEEGNVIRVYESIRSAERDTGCPAGRITECCQQKRTKHKNFKWEYYYG